MNQYVIQISNSMKVRRYLKILCSRQNRYDLMEDLFQFCIIKLMEKDIDVLNDKLNTSNKTVEDYFIGILVNQLRDTNSDFYKTYRNYGFPKSILVDFNFVDNLDDPDDMETKIDKNTISIYDDVLIEDIINKEADDLVLLNRIDRAISTCDPLKVDLFKMFYIDGKTYIEISKYYNIGIHSTISRIKTVRRSVKGLLNKSLSEIRRNENVNRRLKAGKIIITDEVKVEIINRFNNGETKLKLSKEYQLSYPSILKIINKKC